MDIVQLGIIGAMQRCHPAITEAWLQWTGIYELEKADFSFMRVDHQEQMPTTAIGIKPSSGLSVTVNELADVLGIPEGSAQRERYPVLLPNSHVGHNNFWVSMAYREDYEVEGLVEFWWYLLVLRRKSLISASRDLLAALWGDAFAKTKRVVVSFDNPTIQAARRASDLMTNGAYQPPVSLKVLWPASRAAKHEGIEFDLSGDLRPKLGKALRELAIRRSI